MAIRADSYSSTSEVKAVVRYLLDGQPGFNSTTIPTGGELEKFIDRASGVLNLALASVGFNASDLRANSTAKLSLDDWVTAQSATWAEVTQRGMGSSNGEGNRVFTFQGLTKRAMQFAQENELGFKRLGVHVASPDHQGLAFTGLTKSGLRTDPSNTGLEQPFARRNQFDDPQTLDFNQT